jgi:hypothetical protein
MISTAQDVVYTVSLDALGTNDSAITVSIDGTPVTLAAGTPFTAGSTEWIPMSGTYIGSANNTPDLVVSFTGTGGEQLAFLDNISVSEAIPEPAGLGMLMAATAGLAFFGRQSRRFAGPAR